MANTYLERTVTTPDTNGNKKATFSAWLKRGSLTEQVFYTSRSSDSNYFRFRFTSDQINVISKTSGTNYFATTSAVFRDTSSWYQVVVTFDTTQATEANRIRIYVNGVEQTKGASSYPSQDSTLYMLASGQPQRIGKESSDGFYDGSISHAHYTEGNAYDASAFGSTDSTTGEWKINTSPSVTYGANGFFILKDGNSVTDQSGQSNNFAVGGGTLTKTEDCPSNNFATWNPQINNGITGNWLNGNTTIAPNGDTPNLYAPVTIPVSKGKWYSEHMITGGNGHGSLGLAGASNIAGMFKINYEPGETSPSFAFKCINGGIKMNGSNTTYSSAPGTSDVILGMAVDIDNKKVWYHINGTYVTYGGGVGNPSAGTYGFDWSALSDDFGFLVICGDSEVSGYGNWKSNFGNGYFGTTAVSSAGSNASSIGIFEYNVPTGFTAISTKGLNL